MPAMMRMGAQPTPPQVVMEQIREFFDVKTLEKDLKEIPADVDVLLLAQPEGLTPDAAYAIDQYALKGGKVLVFIDPMAEAASATRWVCPAWRQTRQMGKAAGRAGAGVSPTIPPSWRPTTLTRATYSSARQREAERHARLRGLAVPRQEDAFDPSDVLSAGIERLNLASAGTLAKAEGGTTDSRRSSPPATPPCGSARNHRADADAIGYCSGTTSRKASWCWPPESRARPTALSRRVRRRPPRQEGRAGDETGRQGCHQGIAKSARRRPASRRPGVASGNLNVIVIAAHRSAQRPVLGRGARFPGPAGGDPRRPPTRPSCWPGWRTCPLRRADLAPGPRHHRPAFELVQRLRRDFGAVASATRKRPYRRGRRT